MLQLASNQCWWSGYSKSPFGPANHNQFKIKALLVSIRFLTVCTAGCTFQNMSRCGEISEKRGNGIQCWHQKFRQSKYTWQKPKPSFLSPLIWHTDHLPPELSPQIQGGKPCKLVSREKGLETIPHGNCLLRMCKYEYACHINRITPKWSTKSFIIKTAHCRPVAYRTSTQMWCFFNSLYLFALSQCAVNSSPRWFFFAAVHMKSHTSLHMVLWTLLTLRSWNALQFLHTYIYIYLKKLMINISDFWHDLNTIYNQLWGCQ